MAEIKETITGDFFRLGKPVNRNARSRRSSYLLSNDPEYEEIQSG